MPLYMTLFCYTPEALASLAQNPEDRRAAVRELAEEMDARLIAFYYSHGEYHGVVIYEAPDETTGTAITIAAESAGHLTKWQTIPLLTVEDGMEAFRKADASTLRRPGQ